jgi:mannose-1-phosphate guanylyltransferase
MNVGKNGDGLPLRCGIVLAGGEGKRLRSFVQRACGTTLPKQYVSFIGTRSMLEHTFHRAEKLICPERIFTVVNEDHLVHSEVRRQLANRPRHTIVVQPENKETAPGLLLPLIHLYKRYPQSTVTVFPSDHFILEENRFMTHVYLATRLVERDPSRSVFLGVEPSSLESDYGYILPGREIFDSFSLGVRAISSFIEKPTSNAAHDVIQKGSLWNTMVMVFNTGTLLKKVRQIATALYDSFKHIEGVIGKPNYTNVVKDVYRQMESMNFSKGVLEALSRETSSGLTVLPLRGVHWSDWGSERRIISTLTQVEEEQRPNGFAMGMTEPLSLSALMATAINLDN